MNRFIRAGLCASACVLTFSGSVAFAQDEPANSPPEQIIEIIQLKHGAAHEIGSTLQRVVQEVRVIPDERTNSLIVMGSEESIAAAKSLLAAIDVEVSGESPQQSNQNEIRVFPLEHAAADQRLLSTLSMLFRSSDSDKRLLQLALDSRQNTIIASGREANLNALESLLKMMDQSASSGAQPSGELSVRLLWLVGGDSGATRDVPGDLKAVTDELARYGVSGLKLGAQSVVRVSAEGEFSNSFNALLTDDWVFEIVGRVQSQPDGGVRLEIEASAEAQMIPIEGQPGSFRITNQGTRLDTTITTTNGHFVVLSMNPIGNMDSAFVIQVNEAN